MQLQRPQPLPPGACSATQTHVIKWVMTTRCRSSPAQLAVLSWVVSHLVAAWRAGSREAATAATRSCNKALVEATATGGNQVAASPCAALSLQSCCCGYGLLLSQCLTLLPMLSCIL
jgi:hypothetical protein